MDSFTSPAYASPTGTLDKGIQHPIQWIGCANLAHLAENKPFKKLKALYVQKLPTYVDGGGVGGRKKEQMSMMIALHANEDESTLPRKRYFKMHPTTVPYRQSRIIGFRPYLSEAPPITKLEIATPSRAAMGTKYVAAEKSNGAVLGNESS